MKRHRLAILLTAILCALCAASCSANAASSVAFVHPFSGRRPSIFTKRAPVRFANSSTSALLPTRRRPLHVTSDETRLRHREASLSNSLSLPKNMHVSFSDLGGNSISNHSQNINGIFHLFAFPHLGETLRGPFFFHLFAFCRIGEKN